MSIWSILDISPTTNLSDIKRAYATQLKQHRPDSDPTGYQQLREAFDDARHYAEHHSQAVDLSQTLDFSKTIDSALTPTAEWVPFEQATSPDVPPAETPHIPLEQVTALAECLVNDELKGLKALDELLQQLDQRTLAVRERFSLDLANALSEQSGLHEAGLMQVSALMHWDLEQYAAHALPDEVAQRLYQQVSTTEDERAWQEIVLSKNHSLKDKMIATLLSDPQKEIPFWVRLVPDFLPSLRQKLATLLQNNPTLREKINPHAIAYFQNQHLYASWQSLFLTLFWIASGALAASSSHAGVLPIGLLAAVMAYYLYGHNLLCFGLQKTRLLSPFLLLAFLFSLLVGGSLIALIYLKTVFAAADITTQIRPGVLLTLVLTAFIWRMALKSSSFLLLPTAVVTAVINSPWYIISRCRHLFVPIAAIVMFFAYALALEPIMNALAGLG
ncbi:J domain-containing protein [Yersinia mollaretii]|uniref:J domain-containing protein n=1 Tax=Yersinia mollaretii TaxID=33060 RepID=UPI0011A316C9|nr:J domain-containing protein [Yersinia mollaretii]